MKLAAIDIGSNAARLLITQVETYPAAEPLFTKINLVRVPLRLGLDVFARGHISEQKAHHLLQTIRAFRALLEVYEVTHLKACATSAMRDASNGMEVLASIRRETGMSIDIISGSQEGTFINENHIAEHLDVSKTYVYIDVGGGSTELSFFERGKLTQTASFNIGTLRLLLNKVEEAQWNEMKTYLKKQSKGTGKLYAIGSGGNINKIFSMSKRKEGKPLGLETLKDFYKELGSFSVPERMRLYSLREDRADVIVPALQIYLAAMRWMDAEEIYVPKIGLADGLIHALYQEIQPSS